MSKLIPKHQKGNYMQTSTGKVANFQLPEVEVTAQSPTGDAWKDRNRYKAYKGRRYISEGRQEAKPLALGLAGLTAAPALTGVGISSLVQPLDVASVALDPTDWMNWIPFGVRTIIKGPKFIQETAQNLYDGKSNISLGNWSLMLPNVGKESAVFRQGGLDMLDDAMKRQIVAPMTEVKAAERAAQDKKGISLMRKSFTKNAMFNRKTPFYGNSLPFESTKNKAVIVGDINNPNIDWKQNFHKGHKYIFEPYTNGELKAPISEFSFYKRAPFNFGWVKQNANLSHSYPITSNPMRYVKDGKYDTSQIVSDFKKGIEEARGFLNSDTYKQTALRNIREAENMGLHYTPTTSSDGFKSLMNDGVKLEIDTKMNAGGATSMFGGSIGTPTPIIVNPKSKLNYTALHEGLHVGEFGKAPKKMIGESDQQFLQRAKKDSQFLKHKVNEVFKNTDAGVYDFSSQTGEAATNMLDVGKRLNIKWGQAYPGDEQLLSMLKAFENSGDSKSGIVSLLRLDTPEGRQAVWRALNGTMFGLSPAIINKNTQPNN